MTRRPASPARSLAPGRVPCDAASTGAAARGLLPRLSSASVAQLGAASRERRHPGRRTARKPVSTSGVTTREPGREAGSSRGWVFALRAT